MAKHGKARKSDNNNNNNNNNSNNSSSNNNNNNNIFGKGKVTPVQVAFLVDRYLADNNFSQTRSAFRSEASSLLSKSTLQEAPKSLMSLGELLDEYIWLKEQKVVIEQEKFGLNQEKSRVHTLFQGMQDLMNAFNSPLSTNNCLPSPSPPPPPSVPPPPPAATTSSGLPAYRTPIMTSMSMTQSVKMDHTNFTTPLCNSRPPRKRKTYKGLQDAPQAPKKYCGPIATNNPICDRGTNSVAQPSNAPNGQHDVIHQSPLPSLSPNYAQAGPSVQGSSVAKNLFDKSSSSPNSNSSGPKTPPRALSSQSDKSISPLEITSTAKSHNDSTPPETTTTNCTFISSKTIIVSPAKQYSIERSQCTFSSPVKTNQRQNKREHVKGRLDFDCSDVPSNLENVSSGDGSSGSTSSESEKEGDIFELELPNFDVFGPNFSLTELLTDFGIECGATDYSCATTAGPSTDAVSELHHEGNNGELGTSHNQEFIQHSSEVFAGDVSLNGTESVTSVKSITKCITIVSPTKCTKNSPVHEQGSLTAGS